MQKNTLTKTWAVALLAFVSCLLWGSAIPTIKTGYQCMGIDSADVASQILYAGVRFAIAGVMALLLGSLMAGKPPRPTRTLMKLSFQLCLVQTVGQYFFFYIAVAHISGVKGSIITGMSNFFAILLACLVFRQERLSANKFLGSLLGFAGVVLINVSGSQVDMGGFHLNGEGCMLISSLAYACSSVLINRFSKKESPVALSGCQFLMGGLILSAMGLLMGGHLDVLSARSVAILLYLAMVSAVAYSLWSILLKHNPVSRVAVYGFMNPLCGVILSAIMLNEGKQAFRLTTLAALALVCVGIYVVNRVDKMSDIIREEVRADDPRLR